MSAGVPEEAGAPMRPADDPSWASYAETILRVHAVPPFEIDLRHPVPAAARAALAAAGLDGPFGLVTPCNPRGRTLDDAGNAARLAAFHRELRAAGHGWLRVDGLSPDRAHAEEGVALAWPAAEVQALARRWEQSAIYWWDGDGFWVLGALTATAPWRLPEGGG